MKELLWFNKLVLLGFIQVRKKKDATDLSAYIQVLD